MTNNPKNEKKYKSVKVPEKLIDQAMQNKPKIKYRKYLD